MDISIIRSVLGGGSRKVTVVPVAGGRISGGSRFTAVSVDGGMWSVLGCSSVIFKMIVDSRNARNVS